MKKTLLLIIASLLCLALGSCAAPETETDLFKARVVSVIDKTYHDEAEGKYYRTQHLTLRILEGPFKDEVYPAEEFIDAANYADIALYRAGDTVEAFIAQTEDGVVDYVSVHTLVRAPYAVALAVIFLILLAIVGRLKGIKTIAALIFTVSAVVFVLVPLIANGYNAIVSASLVCIVVTLVTMLTVGGFNTKSLAAILGTAGGLVCAAVITLIFSAMMRISGIDTSAVEMLMMANTNVVFNYQGILTAGILISCIGAVMDVGMSIASSLNEMHKIDPAIDQRRLYHAGVSVGRDIIGTMANTLILAYTGGAIMMMVAWYVYGVSYADMLNKGFIIIEVAKSLCGSIGMVMTIPLTAFIASRLICADKKNTAQEQDPDEQPET